MEWIILAFIVFSIVLFGLSFFAGDSQKEIKDDMEQLSLQVMGDIYQVKQRIRVLEEELLTVSGSSSGRANTNQELVNEASQLFRQNKSIEETAAAMELKTDEVKYLLSQLN